MTDYKELIERLRTHALISSEWPSIYGWATKDCNQAADAIEELLNANRWIPVSERLPEVRHNVLTTDGNYTAEGQLQDNGDWMQYRWTCLRKHEEIIAWQPLPEPYKGEKE